MIEKIKCPHCGEYMVLDEADRSHPVSEESKVGEHLTDLLTELGIELA